MMRPVVPNRAAHIRGAHSALVVPTANPYDWQLFCEHAAVAARELGSVRIRVAGVECLVRREEPDSEHCCTECGRALVRVSFRMAWRDLCRDCAQHSLAESPAAAPAAATRRASR